MNTKVKPFDSVVIVGFGDIGRRVAAIWQGNGLNVYGLARSKSSEQLMLDMGIQPIVADLAQADTLTGLPTENALVYYFAPGAKNGNSQYGGTVYLFIQRYISTGDRRLDRFIRDVPVDSSEP